MPRIRIEFVPVQSFALGWLGFDHLQIVFEPDGDGTALQDDWLVLEGQSGRTRIGTTLGVRGTCGGLSLASANHATGAELRALIGTPEARGSVVLPVEGDLHDAWQRMAEYARAINASGFPYCSFRPAGTPFATINSSSVVASLLWCIGIDINDHLPAGIGISPGTRTLLGTMGNDTLAFPSRHFDTLAGGSGDDDLTGTNDRGRIDKMFGGPGCDTFHWSAGFNIIHGGQPGLAEADDGIDTMDYRGAGVVTVSAGRLRVPGVAPDYVVTFTGREHGGGLDWLYSIEAMRLDSGSDTLAMGEGMTKIPRRLSVDMGRLPPGGGLVDLSLASTGLSISAVAVDEIEVSAGGGKGGRSWRISGTERILGSDHDDDIQMTPLMRVAEGGGGDDIIDARLVAPGYACHRHGYDAEIDGGPGDDTLIASMGRTFARGGPGRNTFILTSLAAPGASAAAELIIADAKPDDCLLVPQSLFDARGRETTTRLRRLTGNCERQEAPTDAIAYERDGNDLVIRLGRRRAAAPVGRERRERVGDAVVRVLNYRPGDLGILATI